jgi:hypothetical protein
MEQKFDLNQVEKRIPYTTPEDFFDEMEKNIIERITTQPKEKKQATTLFIRRAILTAAAVACMLFVVTKFMPANFSTEEALAQETSAFELLSAEDQNYFLEVYDEDVFLNDFDQEHE